VNLFILCFEFYLNDSFCSPMLNHHNSSPSSSSSWLWWCFLITFISAYIFFILGIILPIIHIDGVFVGEGSVSITRSTLQSLWQLFDEGYYLPAILILIFTLIVPLVKFCLFWTLIVQHKQHGTSSKVCGFCCPFLFSSMT
jgi:uncharacterized paraquat-inducible protein A